MHICWRAAAALVFLTTLAGAAGAAELVPFHSDKGRFTVSFPKSPKETQELKPSRFKPYYTIHHFVAETSIVVSYVVSYVDHPEYLNGSHTKRYWLQEYRSHMPDYAQGLAQITITYPELDGREGLAFVGVHQHGYQINTHLWIDGMRMYEVTVIDADDERAKDMDAFIASFKFD